MNLKNYATALPAVAGLAAVLLLTACGSGASSHPSARTTTSPSAKTTTSPAQDPAASKVTDQEDSNWVGYVVASSATKKTSMFTSTWAAGNPRPDAMLPVLDEGQLEALRQVGREWEQTSAEPRVWRQALPVDPALGEQASEFRPARFTRLVPVAGRDGRLASSARPRLPALLRATA